MGREGGVESYSCPESSAVRYKQPAVRPQGGTHPPHLLPNPPSFTRLLFQAARIHLTYRPGAGEGAPKSIFVKRAVLRDLPHARAKATA